jgi:uncharacterized membrane protein YfcA
MTLLLVFVVSFIAGAVNAVAGGGTFLTFPTLTGLAGLSERVANMTSTIGLWPGSAASVYATRSEFRRLPVGMVVSFAIISLLGGGAGAWLLLHTTDKQFVLVIPWLLGFATLIFACSKPIARWAGRHQGGRSLKWTAFVGIVQVAVSVYGGYFGAGIGVLMLAGLSFAGLEDVHQMNALKVLLSTLINLVAAVVFLFYPINWPIAGAMAVASIAGGFLGMLGARKVQPDKLRLIIIGIGLCLTAYYFYNAYKPHR